MKIIRNKDKNGGFSLIELVITLLIMAILMVALAPQVTKWVENARISSDNQLRNSLVSYAQLALTDSQVYEAAFKGNIEIKADNSGCTIEGKESLNIADFARVFADYASTTVLPVTSNSLYKLDDSRIRTKTEGRTITVKVERGMVSCDDVFEFDELGINSPGGSSGESGGVGDLPGGNPGEGGIIGTIIETLMGDDGNTHTISQQGDSKYLDNKPLYDSLSELVTIAGNPRSRVYVRRSEGGNEYYDMYQWNRLNGDDNEWGRVDGNTIRITP